MIRVSWLLGSRLSGMEDVEVALLVSLYVLLVQTLCASQPQFAVEDDILLEISMSGGTLYSHYSCIAMSTAALYDY